MIRAVHANDADKLKDIYNYYVANTVVTFEETAISTKDMIDLIDESTKLELPWLVAEQDGEIFGYAHANRWKGRCAYRHTVEVTVIV